MNYLLFRILFLSFISLVGLFIVVFIIFKKKWKFDNISFDILLIAIFSFLFVLFSLLYNLYFYLGKFQLSLFLARISWNGVFVISSGLMLALDLRFPRFKRIYKYLISFIPALIIFIPAILTDKGFKKFIIIKNIPVLIGGEYETIFRLIYMAPLFVTIVFLFDYYKKETGYKKKQISYFIYGTMLYAIGSVLSGTIVPFFTTSLLIKDLLYDSIMIFLMLWLVFLTYAIIKYRLMEIETIFHKTLIWIIVSFSILLPLLLFFYFTAQFFHFFSRVQLAIIFFIIVYLFNKYNNYLQPRIDRFFQRRKYNREKFFENFIRELSILSGIEDLHNKITQVISVTLYSENVKLFIYNNNIKDFVEFTKGLNDKRFQNQWFTGFLEKNEEIVEKDMLLYDPKYSHIKAKVLRIFKRMNSELCIPFTVNHQLVGFMFLGKKSNLKNYTLEDIDFLEMLRSPIAIAINNSITYSMAITDPLTGLYNRYFLFHLLEKEINKCKRYSNVLTLMFVDMDYLKKLNDIYGHRIGDICLKELAKEILKNTRDSDICVRYGGDEFLVLMPNTTIKGALAASSRLLRSIQRKIVRVDGKKIKISVSIGVAQYDHRFKNYNELLIMVDKALYKAKLKGRNRVEIM